MDTSFAASTSSSEFEAASGQTRFWTSEGFYWIVFALLVTAVWVPRLFRSFWVDEAGTWWMAQGGPIAALQKTWHWPGQSLLYSAIASLFCLNRGPLLECTLRIPSLIGIAIACYFLYRLAETVIGRGAGLLSLTVFLLHPIIVRIGTEARPYALALGAAAASCWTLYRWVETRKRNYLGAYLVCSALIIYLHYLFIGLFLVQAFYLAYIFLVERRAKDWHLIPGVWVALAGVTLPLAPHLRLLLHQGRTLPFRSVQPDILELTSWIVPPILIFGLFVSALLIQIVYPSRPVEGSALRRSTLVFLSLWLLLIPCLYFAVSIATKTIIFVDRYISFSVEAAALLFAAAGYLFFGAFRARIWVIVAVLLSTASPIAILHGFHPGNEDLKPFMQIIRSESQSNEPPPVFFRSELPESTFNNWRAGLKGYDSHYFAPFAVYPMPNRLVPLPFHFTKEAKAYISEKLDSDLRDVPKIIFVTHEPKWNSWVTQRMREAGFVPVRKEQPNSFYVTVFQKSYATGGHVTGSSGLADQDSEDPVREKGISN